MESSWICEKVGIWNNWVHLIQWLLLSVILFIVAMLLFLIMQFVTRVPAVFTSFVIGLAFALVAEWIIFDYPQKLSHLKNYQFRLSLQLLLQLRFVFETAVFISVTMYFDR